MHTYRCSGMCKNLQSGLETDFSLGKKTFIIIPTFDLECLGFLKCGNIWQREDCIANKFINELKN